MPNVRKTRDYWAIQQYTEQGWEDVHTVDSWREARQSLKEYRENQPEYLVRAQVRRETIAAA